MKETEDYTARALMLSVRAVLDTIKETLPPEVGETLTSPIVMAAGQSFLNSCVENFVATTTVLSHEGVAASGNRAGRKWAMALVYEDSEPELYRKIAEDSGWEDGEVNG